MARPTTRRQSTTLEAPLQELLPKPLWYPYRGLDLATPDEFVEPSFATDARNVVTDPYGRLVPRRGTAIYPDIATTGSVVRVVVYKNSAGRYLVRFDTDAIYVFTGSAWTAVTGAGPFTGTVENIWAVTPWGDRLVASNGVDGMVDINVVAGTMTTISGAPSAKFLTTFGGRVIAVDTTESSTNYPMRIRWSVKNSSSDWAGIGSGFEDLTAGPERYFDPCFALFGIRDDLAMLVRERSVWQVVLTGTATAPFRFSTLTAGVGAKARHSIVSGNGGVIFLGHDDVYYASPGTLKPLGAKVRKDILERTGTGQRAFAVWDDFQGEYRLGLEENLAGYINAVWRYSFKFDAWHRDVYPFPIRTMGVTTVQQIGTIDEGTGTFDASGTASIDSDGFPDALGESVCFVQVGADRRLVFEDRTVTTDTNGQGGNVATTAHVTSGIVRAEGPARRTEYVKIEVTYSAASAVGVTVDFTQDEVVWELYSTRTLEASQYRTVHLYRTLDRRYAKVRLTFDTLTPVVIHSFTAYVQPGAEVTS